MLIIPAIYVANGRAVSHYKGESDQEIVFSKDPLNIARVFKKQGATVLHFVDLDGNKTVAASIVKNTGFRVQYACKISSIDQIKELFGLGIYVVSLDQSSENLIPAALKEFGPEKIFFTIRSQRNLVEDKNGVEVFHYGADIAKLEIKNIITSDKKAEGSLHPNFDEVERLILSTKGAARIFAFGGIGSVKDLEILKNTGAYGAIVSRAFLENQLSLAECLRRFSPGIGV